MLAVSPTTMQAFGQDRVAQVAADYAALIRTAHPGITGVLDEPALLARTRAAINAGSRHDVRSRRDLLILCLVHVLNGPDALEQSGLAWMAQILAEPRCEPDTRAYRIHCRLASG